MIDEQAQRDADKAEGKHEPPPATEQLREEHGWPSEMDVERALADAPTPIADSTAVKPEPIKVGDFIVGDGVTAAPKDVVIDPQPALPPLPVRQEEGGGGSDFGEETDTILVTVDGGTLDLVEGQVLFEPDTP